MRGRARGQQAAESTVTIPVQATTAGAITANQFTGWTHGAGTVVSRSLYGTTAKYFYTTDSDTVSTQSRAISRDQEITFWASEGRVYLRMTDDGRALRFETKVFAGGGGPPDGGGWEVRFVIVGNSGYSSDQQIYQLAEGLPSGVDTGDTAGDQWTFGVEGFDVYVKWNGVEQWRSKQLFCIKPGRIGLRSNPNTSEHGFREVSATFKRSAALYSSPEFGICDVRDFGLQTLTAVGSMAAASTTLTLVSNPGFAIGDKIVVEIGGESGLGVPGTRGVGGQWPTLTYANATAMNADTGQVTSKMAALLDTGIVYQWNGSAWTQYATSGYHYLMVPKALLATITNVSGTTITLDTASTVATTSANVYFNCSDKYEEVLGFDFDGVNSYVSDKTIYWPAGEWVLARWNDSTSMGLERENWNYLGASRTTSKFINPKGTCCVSLSFVSLSNCTLNELGIRTNRRWDNGWGWFYAATTEVPTQDVPGGITIASSTGVATTNMNVTNGIIQYAQCTNSHFDDIELEFETGQLAYSLWCINISDSDNCYGRNITFTGPYLTPFMEIFRSTNSYYEDVTATNGIMAINSAATWRCSRFNLTLEDYIAGDSRLDWASSLSPIVNINSNIENTSETPSTGGGVFEDFEITVEGYLRDTDYPFVFSVSGLCEYVTIQGDFPTKPNTNGLITVPAGYDQIAIDTEAGMTEILVDGVRINGGSATPILRVQSADGGVTNSVCDSISTTGTNTGNITNAAYNAL